MYKVLVQISGGKDSQACLKLATEHYDSEEILGLFCDTGWEHPITYQHIEDMRNRYGVRIDSIKSSSVCDLIIRYKQFPGRMTRFCTDKLKIIPANKYQRKIALEQKEGFEVWIGIRRDESIDRAKRYAGINTELNNFNDIFPSSPKYLNTLGIKLRLPILDWSSEDVFSYLGNFINPLYKTGFGRVGCFPCLATSNKNHQNAFNFDSFGYSQKLKITELEKLIGMKHIPANTDQYCMFCQI